MVIVEGQNYILQEERGIQALLLDLARLAQQQVMADASNTPAQTLLEKVLALCLAQYGALFLLFERPSNDGGEHDSGEHEQQAEMKLQWHLLAHNSMSDESLAQLQTALAHEQGSDHMQPKDLLLWQCSLVLPSTLQYGGRERTRSGAAVAATSARALFFIGWQAKAPADGQASIDVLKTRGVTLLSLVADSIRSVLVNFLLTVRVAELDAELKARSMREVKLLRAELLATVSHELRTPLAAIKGYAATLLRHERRISREERREFLHVIAEASDRLEEVINRLLEMSQLETEGLTLRLFPVNLIYLVHEAITAARARYEGERSKRLDTAIEERKQGDITFQVQVENEDRRLPYQEPIVRADRLRLREVLDHLLENAVQYSPSGGLIKVGIRTCTVEELDQQWPDRPQKEWARYPHDQMLVELWVRDQGIGIPMQHQHHVFERFYRVNTHLTRSVNGLGLGLTLCKWIVELHGGVIWLESEEGRGSTFHVLLPRSGPQVFALQQGYVQTGDDE
ncbi:MAG: HAMP domain-containing histidine kinase [Ktedonobacteraceae bacterium]|nr:HAMP domain-containing histidine kinase [Ktedonobacteraceae bacterium]